MNSPFRTIKEVLSVPHIASYLNLFKTDGCGYGKVGQLYESFFILTCMSGAYNSKRHTICNRKWKSLSEREVLASSTSNNGDGGIDIRMLGTAGRKIRVQGKLFMKDHKKNIASYGLSELGNDVEAAEGDDIHYILLVNNEEEVRATLSNCRHPRKERVVDVVGIDRLQSMWNGVLQLQERGELLTSRIPVQKRPHQEHAINQIEQLYSSGENTILLAHLPRAGKTLTVLLFMAANVHLYSRIIITTPIPTETAPSFLKWLREMSGFEGYDVIYQQNEVMNAETIVRLQQEDTILITSSQWLNKNYEKLPAQDLLVADEHDFYSCSAVSQTVFDYFERENKDIKFFFMTATAMKAIETYNIPSSCILYWTLEDINDMRELTSTARARLLERQGSSFAEVLDHYPDPSLPYKDLPRLVVQTAQGMFQQLDAIQKDLSSSYAGYSLLQLGMAESDDLARVVLASIFGVGGQQYFREEARSCNAVINRAKRMYQAKGIYKTKWQVGIWMSRGNFVAKAERIKAVIETMTGLEGYKVLILHGDMDNKKEFKDEVDALYAEASAGLIILACQMGRRGVSFEDMDMTILLDQTQSLAMYLQTGYRCMTERKDKCYGFIVDFHETRVLDLIASAADTSRCINTEEKIVEIRNFMANCMMVDTSMFTEFRTEGDEFILAVLERQAVLITAYHSQVLTKMLSPEDYPLDSIFIKAKFNSPRPAKPLVEEVEKLPLGIDSEVTGKVTKPAKVLGLVPAKAPLRNHDPLTDVLRLAVLMYEYEPSPRDLNVVEILQDLLYDEELVHHFNTLLKTWNAEIGDNALEELIKLFQYNDLYRRSDIVHLVKGMQHSFRNISTIQERHKLISSFLPSSSSDEIKMFGGINTSLTTVERLLDKAPIDWTNPSLRFFEPGCGFAPWSLVAYQKLMDNLPIEDEEDRREHILTNMLYFDDIQQRNVTVVKLVFGLQYELKVNCEDFFALDREWKADVVMGNPPFKCEGRPAAWKDFTLRILDDWLAPNGCLVFVNPVIWRKEAGKNDRSYGYYQELTRDRQMLYIETCGNKKPGVAPHDYFVLVNRSSTIPTLYVNEKGIGKECDLSQTSSLGDDVDMDALLRAEDGEVKLQVLKRNGKGGRTDGYNKKKWEKGDMSILPHYIAQESRTPYTKRVVSSSGQVYYANEFGPALQPLQVDEYKYPVVCSSARIRFCKIPEPGYGRPKVIMVDGSKTKILSVMDWKGEYGVSEHALCIFPETEEDALELYDWLQYKDAQAMLLNVVGDSDRQLNFVTMSNLKHDFWRYWVPSGSNSPTSSISSSSSSSSSLSPLTPEEASTLSKTKLEYALSNKTAKGDHTYTIPQLKQYCRYYNIKPLPRVKSDYIAALLPHAH